MGLRGFLPSPFGAKLLRGLAESVSRHKEQNNLSSKKPIAEVRAALQI